MEVTSLPTYAPTDGVSITVQTLGLCDLEARVVLAPEEALGFTLRCTWEGDDEQSIEIPVEMLPTLRNMLAIVEQRLKAKANGIKP